jgi:flagellar biogenesis protein FliO
MKGYFGHDGVSITRKSKSAAPLYLLLLGVFFNIGPLLFGTHPGSSNNQPVARTAAIERPAGFVGPLPPPEVAQAATVDADWHQAETDPAWAPSGDFLSKLRGMSGILVLISILIVVSLNLLKKTLPQLGPSAAGARPLMKVIARQAISAGVELCVVQIGPKNLVLSISEQSGVQTVTELSNEDLEPGQASDPVVPTTLAAEVARPTAGQVYGQIFRQYLGIIPGLGAPKR